MGYVKFNSINQIETRLGINPNGKVQKFVTNTLYKEMDDFVPMREGNLRKNVDVGSDTITYESPYASYQYYGIRKDGSHEVKNYTTAGTGNYWDKRMWSARKDKVLNTIQKKVDGK